MHLVLGFSDHQTCPGLPWISRLSISPSTLARELLKLTHYPFQPIVMANLRLAVYIAEVNNDPNPSSSGVSDDERFHIFSSGFLPAANTLASIFRGRCHGRRPRGIMRMRIGIVHDGAWVWFHATCHHHHSAG
jgi:hypothetical protein